MLALYINEASAPLFGAENRWRRFELAESRGEIHFHTFAICENKLPNRLLREMGGGESNEVADVLARRECPFDHIAAPYRYARGGLDAAIVRVPGGEWAPTKDTDASGLLFRDSESFRSQCLARANS